MTVSNDDWKKDRIGAAIQGQNPMVITEMSSGFAVMGDTQFLPGYCVLLPNRLVGSLEELSYKERTSYLLDASLLGEAVLISTEAKRVNYSIYGNTDAFLHTHVFPRYHSEPLERIGRPVWDYPVDRWKNEQYAFQENTHGELKNRIKKELTQLMQKAYTEKDRE